MKKYPLLLVWALTALRLSAQSTAFNYQGQLAEGVNPANGIYDLQFTLFDTADAGNQVGGVLTNAATQVSNGRFIVTLDFGNQFPGADRWLEIGVRTNGAGAFTTLTPRQRIHSTPYAIQSANAASATSVSGSISASQLTGAISSNNIGAGSITTVMLAPAAVGSNQLADGAVTAAKVATVNSRLLLTIPNPTPADFDNFALSVTAVGSDRMLIGAWQDDTGANNAGVAYLFSTSGALLTTFTNPTPADTDYFGHSVAALGTDRVLIGAYQDDTGANDAGAVYLFSTGGALLMTFTNPAPAAGDNFGYSVAALGSDRVLIGAWHDDTGANDAGAAYLFSTNGALLATFTNPMPASGDTFGDNFGESVMAVGTDRVLIGAYWDDTGTLLNSGVAYLFSTNGALLTTFTNPTPGLGDWFGHSVAAVSSDRVLIGAFGDDTRTANAGVAYLFSTSGALLTTFTNPVPASSDWFGYSVAAVGTERVLIGAYGASGTGAAYLFSTNGSLLATMTNPTSAAGARFGFSVAATADQALIGASTDGTGAIGAGAAYVFALDSYAQGLIADGVRMRSVTTASLADGAVTASKIGGMLSASQIPDLNASKISSGTLADGRLSTNVALLNVNNQFSGTNGLNDRDLRLRGVSDPNHAVGWYGPGKPFAGFSPDGPMLFGYAAGGLGTTVSTQRVALMWNSAGRVGIGTSNPGSALDVAGTVTASNFNGNGAGVTNLNLLTANSQGAISWTTNWTTNFTGKFVTVASPWVGTRPAAVTAADVNGDGKMDLITVNQGNNSFTIMTNNGSGDLTQGFGLAAGNLPSSVTTADVNGDGSVDLICANAGDNTLTIHTNNGNGGFALASSPSVGVSPNSVAAADVNGDGSVDLITANPNSFNLSVLTNNGSGVFALALSPAVSGNPVAVTTADINGDGRLDLISANSGNNTVVVWTNSGGGGFVFSSSSTVGFQPASVVAADVNSDSKVDVISANLRSDTLTVLTNNGSGGLVVASSPLAGWGPVSVAAADVNGDGKPDLITANEATGPGNTLSVLTNKGGGGFSLAATLVVGQGVSSVAAADFNGDGGVDLVSANTSSSTITILFNTATIAVDYTGNFTGNGAGLSGVSASNLTGTVPLAHLPGAVLTNHATDVNLTGSFTGNGSALTALSATNVTSGTMADARLSANVPLLNVNNQFTGTNSLNDRDLRLRGVSDANHAVGWYGSGKPFAGFSPDGPMLFGYAAGGLGTTVSTQRVALMWNSAGRVGIGTSNPGSALDVAGTVTASTVTASNFSGNASGLTNVQAVNLTGSVPSALLTSVPAANLTGTVADARLSSNVPLLNANNVFTGQATFLGALYGSAPYLKYAEVTTGTTQGGTANAGADNWRKYNVEMTDTHNLGSTNGAGDIILPAGTYQCRVSAPAYGVSTHQIRLRTSDGTTLLFGTIAYAGDAAANDRSLAEGQFTLPAATTVRVQHWCFTGNTGNGLGALDTDPDIWGDVPNFNIFATAEFWKIK